MSYNTMILSNGLIVVLILLLVLSANFAYRYTQQIQELWDDNCYLLKITQLVEFRLALVELQLLADGQQWDQELLSVG